MCGKSAKSCKIYGPEVAIFGEFPVAVTAELFRGRRSSKTKLFRETSFKTYLSKPRLTSEFSDFEMMPHKYCSQLLFLKEVSQKSFVFELSTKVSSSISWLVGWLVG
jgi:hypothetical protein